MSAAPTKNIPQPPADGDEPALGGVHTQAPFRAVNEEIRRVGDGFAVRELLEFVCECGRRDCFARCSLSLDDYEAIRRFPTRFLVKADHVGADDRIVSKRADYVVVEKVGRSAASAIRLDPRRRAAPAEAR